MIRTTLALALVGLAAAQPALDVGPNGGLRVTRQVSTSLSGKTPPLCWPEAAFDDAIFFPSPFFAMAPKAPKAKHFL